jgi:hypothetical protein
MSEVLAFDWGTTIVGVLDITTDVYRAYRSRKERLEGAKRIVDCPSIIVSFNGSGRDLPELATILGLPPPAHCKRLPKSPLSTPALMERYA